MFPDACSLWAFRRMEKKILEPMLYAPIKRRQLPKPLLVRPRPFACFPADFGTFIRRTSRSSIALRLSM